jgi:hypothetical protein
MKAQQAAAAEARNSLRSRRGDRPPAAAAAAAPAAARPAAAAAASSSSRADVEILSSRLGRADVEIVPRGPSQAGWEMHRDRFMMLSVVQLHQFCTSLRPDDREMADRVIRNGVTSMQLLTMDESAYRNFTGQLATGSLWNALMYLRGAQHLGAAELAKVHNALNCVAYAPVPRWPAAAAAPSYAQAAAAASSSSYAHIPAAAAASSSSSAAASASAPAALTSYPDPSLFVVDPEKFLCSICTGVAFEPPNLECSHLFCKRDLADWAKTAAGLHCPNCRAAFTPAQLESKNGFVMTEICNMKVKCEHHEQGCTVITEIGTGGRGILKHRSECKFMPQPCPKCRVMVGVGGQPKHEKEECAKRPEKCEQCQAMIPKDEMREHTLNRRWNGHPVWCANLQICPNMCRGENGSGTRNFKRTDAIQRVFSFVFCCCLSSSYRNLIQHFHRDLTQHMGTCNERQVICSFCPRSHPIKMKEVRSHVSGLKLDPMRYLDCAISLLRPVEEPKPKMLPQAQPPAAPAAAASAAAAVPLAGQQRTRSQSETESKSNPERTDGAAASSASRAPILPAMSAPPLSPSPSPSKKPWAEREEKARERKRQREQEQASTQQQSIWSPSKPPALPAAAAAAPATPRVIPFNVNGQTSSASAAAASSSSSAAMRVAPPSAAFDAMDIDASSDESDSLARFRESLQLGGKVDFAPRKNGFAVCVIRTAGPFICEVQDPRGEVHKCFLTELHEPDSMQPRLESTDASESSDEPSTKRQKA